VHGGVHSSKAANHEAALSLKEFTDVNALERLPVIITGVLATQSWKAPLPGMYKINWNVAIDSKNRRMGSGIIARDCEGQVIAPQMS
jgi:hypothetical protein